MEYSDFVILLARQRSGTNPLRAVLGSHSEIFCFPEVFNNRVAPRQRLGAQANYFYFVTRHTERDSGDVLRRDDDEEVFLDFLEYLRCFTPKRFLLIDVKYSSTHHVTKAWRFVTEEPHLFFLIRKHGLRVLNLQRRNYLRYCLSELKAQRSRRWTLLGGSSAASAQVDQTIEVDVEWLLRTLELCRSEDAAVSRSFENYSPVLRLDYEHLFPQLGASMAQPTLDRVADWLGIAPAFAETKPRHRKQSLLPLDETIQNYDEVAEALRGTDFEYCLEDEAIYRASKDAQEAVASQAS
jgi:hypothetical protein